jgi:hypothetical protein
MTDAEWLTCSDPLPMLSFLFGRPVDECSTEDLASARKKLLLDCACYSRLGRLVPLYGRLWQAHAEKAAEGEYPKDLLGSEGEDADCELLWALNRVTEEEAERLRALLDVWTLCYNRDGTAPPFHPERAAQAALVRDIYGNPFRPVTLDPSCAAPAVTTVACAIYEANAFDYCMDRLIEALQEAGCSSKEILDHCREPGPHVRGCWVVDLLLGKL